MARGLRRTHRARTDCLAHRVARRYSEAGRNLKHQVNRGFRHPSAPCGMPNGHTANAVRVHALPGFKSPSPRFLNSRFVRGWKRAACWFLHFWPHAWSLRGRGCPCGRAQDHPRPPGAGAGPARARQGCVSAAMRAASRRRYLASRIPSRRRSPGIRRWVFRSVPARSYWSLWHNSPCPAAFCYDVGTR
jgi:hypothetical protein